MSGNPPADNHPPDELAQLPHGRHGLPVEFVDNNQRQRLIASFTHLVGEVGFSGATIGGVTEGAAVSNRTFYKFFETIDDVCVAAFDQAVAELRPLVAEAYRSESEWPRKVRSVLAVVLEDFSQLPDQGRLLTVEPFVAGPGIARRHKAVLEEMVPFLREGRELRPEAAALPESAERGILGAVNSMIGRHLLAGEAERLPELCGDLVRFVVGPYLGAEAARRVLG